MWLERTELSRRPSEFGALDWDGEHVAMGYTRGSSALWDAWLTLPPHADVLCPVSRHRLRYAALDFEYEPSAEALATAGAKLATIAELLLTLAPTEASLFVRPVLYFDVQSELRIAFNDAAGVAQQATPIQQMIYAIGLTLAQYGGKRSFELNTACTRCVDGKVTSLGDVRELFKLAGADVIGTRPPRKIYELVEPGIALVHLGKLAEAHRRFGEARERAPRAPYVRALFEATKPKSIYARYEARDPQRPRALYAVDARGRYARYEAVPEESVEWSAIADAAAEHERQSRLRGRTRCCTTA